MRGTRDICLLLLPVLGGACCNQAPSPFEGAWTAIDGGVVLACDAGTFLDSISPAIVIIDESGNLYAWINGEAQVFVESGDRASHTGSAFIILASDGGTGSPFALTLDSDTLAIDGDILSGQAHGSQLDYSAGGVPSSCDYSRGFEATRNSP